MDKYYISWLGSAVLDTPAKWTELLPVNADHFAQLKKVTGIGYRPIFYDEGSVDSGFAVWPACRNFCVARVSVSSEGEEKLEIIKPG